MRNRATVQAESVHRIVSLSMVKNEQDIIEPFIRYNARFVDCMVILDNASVDETRKIAMDCARELGAIIVAEYRLRSSQISCCCSTLMSSWASRIRQARHL